jgi:transcriptional regulator with XRE-family HTH domain
MREICGFSVQEIADKLSLSSESYEQYEENGEDIPINVLYRLSQLFEVDLNELMTGNAPHLDTYCHVVKGRGLSVDRYPGYRFLSLAHTYRNRVMEPLLVTVDVSDKDPELVCHGGQEFNLCLTGVIEVLFDGKVIRLEPGDTLYFNPSRPHGQRAVGIQSTFLTVITKEEK